MYTFFFVQTVWRLITLGIDFSSPENQNGDLFLSMEFLLSKEQIIETLKKRKTDYEVISIVNDTYYIQFASNTNEQIKLQVHNNGKVRLSIQQKEKAWFTIGFSTFWRHNTKHLFHFHKLIKDAEIKSVRGKQAILHSV